jgi:hypothetical protein
LTARIDPGVYFVIPRECPTRDWFPIILIIITGYEETRKYFVRILKGKCENNEFYN